MSGLNYTQHHAHHMSHLDCVSTPLDDPVGRPFVQRNKELSLSHKILLDPTSVQS
jgi:hypothetical protein